MKPHKDINIVKDLVSEFGTNDHSIPQYVLLYDNFENNIDPIKSTLNKPACKVEQMVLLLVTQGEMHLIVNGESAILQKQEFIYITPDSIVEYKAASNDLKYLGYVMYPQILKDALNDLGLDFNLLNMSHTFKYAKCDEELFNYRISIYHEFKEELQRPDYKLKPLFARAYANIILINNINLLNLDLVVQGNKISRQMNVYKKFLDLLNEYSIKEREVQFYASKLDITPKYLSAVTLEYSGKNASSWIDEYVTTKAKTLLREQQQNIKTVSECLNFPSQSFFGRYFKRVTGMSPKQFINAQKPKTDAEQ